MHGEGFQVEAWTAVAVGPEVVEEGVGLLDYGGVDGGDGAIGVQAHSVEESEDG